jgi:hypothetical protein
MSLLQNTAEGGTNGSNATNATTGGGSGDAFTAANKGSGASLIFATAAADHGSLGYSITGTSGTATFVGWTGYNDTSIAVRFYYNPGPTLPSTSLRLIDIRSSSATAARVMLNASNILFGWCVSAWCTTCRKCNGSQRPGHNNLYSSELKRRRGD